LIIIHVLSILATWPKNTFYFAFQKNQHEFFCLKVLVTPQPCGTSFQENSLSSYE